MSPVEAAYVGAMLDGEGTVRLRARGDYLEIANSDMEIISALVRATGIGSVYLHRNKGKLGKKDVWLWFCNRKEDLPPFLAQVAPYSVKAQRMMAYKMELAKSQFEEVAAQA